MNEPSDGADVDAGRESEAKYHALFEAMTEGFCVIEALTAARSSTIEDYRIVEMNPAFEDLTGLSKKYTLHVPARDVFHSKRAPHLDVFSEVMTSQVPVSLESRFFAPAHLFGMSVFPLTATRIAVLLVDITEQKRTEEALRISESRFRALFDQMSTGVTVYDPGQRGERFIIRDVNRAGEMIDGIRRDEIVGREIRDVFPAVVEFGLIDVFEQVWRTGEPVNMPLAMYRDERISGWRENHVYRLPSGEIVSLYRDVTERRAMERKVLSKQKMEAIGQLAGGVASDFNNILSLMSGHASTIAELVPPNSRAHHHACRLLEAHQYAGKLTKRLLSVARTSVEKEGQVERVSLQVAIADTLSLVEGALRQHGVKCLLKLPENGSDVMVDDAQLRDVLINLILNSLKAMSGGGGTIRIDAVEREVVTPGTRQNPSAKPGPYTILRIRDTGHGIKRGIIDRIFEPFFTTEKSGGSLGLGLSMVQSAVHMWGGWIEVRSREDIGSSFRLFIPRVPGAVSEGDGTKVENTVLVVDDQGEYVELIREAVEHDGHSVITATSAEQAAEHFKQEGDGISLSIIDAMLPNGGGKTLLQTVLSADPTAKVIMMSGFSHDYVRGYLSRGAWGFLQKPFDSNQIAAAVRSAIEP